MKPRYYSSDPNEGVALGAIEPSASKVQSWLSRAVERPGFPLDREVQIRGAIDILSGLEYHHASFLDRLTPLKALMACVARPIAECPLPPPPSGEERQALSTFQHEVVAYINRLGQLHYFAKSLGLLGCLVNAESLLPFRNKYTAHRSVDYPQKNETEEEREAQAMTFGFGHTFIAGRLIFQIPVGKTYHQFNMQDDHPILMSEAVTMFEAIYPLPADA